MMTNDLPLYDCHVNHLVIIYNHNIYRARTNKKKTNISVHPAKLAVHLQNKYRMKQQNKYGSGRQRGTIPIRYRVINNNSL